MDQSFSIQRGLSHTEARSRLERYGPNTIEHYEPFSIKKSFFKHLRGAFSLILLGASILSFIAGGFIDGVLLVILLFVTLALHVYHERKARVVFDTLRALLPKNALAVRDGKEMVILHENVVPGDILLIRPGDKIPADGIIIDGSSIRVNEAVMTGETESVDKHVTSELYLESYPEEVRVYAGTSLVRGDARILVGKTGTSTRFAQIIANSKKGAHTEEMLGQMTRTLSRWFLIIGGVVILGVVIVGIMRGTAWYEMAQLGAALLVSVVPEGLPLVLSMILGLGMYAMSREGVLVKNMNALTHVGSVTHLAFDKTGTLTKNELMVTDVLLPCSSYDESDQSKVLHHIEITGEGYQALGEAQIDGKALDHFPSDLFSLCVIESLCANAQLRTDEDDGTLSLVGDPTEGAMLALGQKFTYEQDVLRGRYPLIHELTFDFKKKYYVSVFRVTPERSLAVITGASEEVIDRCTKVWTSFPDVYSPHVLQQYAHYMNRDMDEAERRDIVARGNSFSARGKRMIGIGVKFLHRHQSEVQHRDLHDFVFAGMVAMQDTVRPDAQQMIQSLYGLHLEPIMITGDHARTALAIAGQVGLVPHEYARSQEYLATGADITERSADFPIEDYRVWARVKPEGKRAIVDAYHDRGVRLAMTGDGVNDVPSLAAADIGIAMGIKGTDAAREAADMVLLEDELEDIPRAFHEGRRMITAVWFVVAYLVGTNLLELMIIAGLSLFGVIEPLTPLQIIWINVVTDSLLVIPFMYEVMKNPPARELLFQGRTLDTLSLMKYFKKWFGGLFVLGIVVTGIGALLMQVTGEAIPRSVLMIFLIGFQLIHMFILPRVLHLGNPLSVRSFPRWYATIALGFAFHIALFGIKPLRDIFSLEALGWGDGALILALILAAWFVGRTTLVGWWGSREEKVRTS